MRKVAAAGLAALAVVLFLLPVPARILDVGPLVRVEPPGRDEPAHPCAAFHKRPVLVSTFLDLGNSAAVAPVAIEGTLWAHVFVRSAHRARSFLIDAPPPGPLRWAPLTTPALSVRRYVQLAVPAEEATGTVRLRLAYRPVTWRFLGPLLLAALLLVWDRLATARRHVVSRLRVHAAPLAAAAIAGGVVLVTATGPLPFVAHGDEGNVVAMAEGILTTSDYRIPGFKYPHPHAYAQAAGAIAYGLGRAATGGLAYHDPFTNQLYYDGQPFARERVFQPDYASRVAPESLPWIRRGYVALFGILVLVAYAMGALARSPRAGLLAALAVAVQPVLRDAAILPNMTGALLAVAAGFVFLRAAPSTASAFWKGLAAGLVVAWKHNPTFAVLLVAVILIESPKGARVGRTLLGLAAMPLGFWIVFPDLPWQLPRFAADVAREAFTYSSVAHGVFATDEPLKAALFQVHLGPAWIGNIALTLFALVGIAVVGARAPWREKWVLLWPPIGASLFMLGQFLQFGRNYAIPMAYAFILSGIGGDALLGWIGRRWGRVAVLAAGVLVVAAPLQVLAKALMEERSLGPSARSQAIEWLDAHAKLGDRVIMVESSLDELEGRQPDRARFQVRRREVVPDARPGKEAAYLIVNESTAATVPANAVVRARFSGGAVWGSSGSYAVYEASARLGEPGPKEP